MSVLFPFELSVLMFLMLKSLQVGRLLNSETQSFRCYPIPTQVSLYIYVNETSHCYSMLPQPNNDFTNIYRVSRFFTNSVLQSLPTPWSPYYLYIYRIDVSFGFPDSFRHVGGLIQHCSISLSILTIFVQLRLNDEPLFVVSLESIITTIKPINIRTYSYLRAHLFPFLQSFHTTTLASIIAEAHGCTAYSRWTCYV